MKNELKKYHYDLMYPGKMINPLTTFMDAKNVAKFQPNPARRPIKISSRVKKGFSPPTSVLQEEELEESDTNDIPDAHERSEVVSSMAMSPKEPSRLQRLSPNQNTLRVSKPAGFGGFPGSPGTISITTGTKQPAQAVPI